MAHPLTGRDAHRFALVAILVAPCGACSPWSSPHGTPPGSIDAAVHDDASFDAGGIDAGVDGFAEAAVGGDAGYPEPDGSTIRSDRFVTSVVSIERTGCTGFGAGSVPGIVEGPPVGGGTDHGSLDVVSLGSGGSIVVSFGANAIVDGPGNDFIVFENPFWIADNSSDLYAEPGEVSVSDDGTTWTTFPCTPTLDPSETDGTGVAPPFGACAGWHAVYSAPGNGISPVDPTIAGGDAFDLSTIGVTHARFVRIVDQTHEDCPDSGTLPNKNGFDLDAVSIVNAELP